MLRSGLSPRPGYLERIRTPLLILASEGDIVVSTPDILRAALRLPDARVHVYGKDVAHEILREGRPGA
jgi:lysophospholipase